MHPSPSHPKSQRAFTLAEVMMVITIIAVLAAISFGSYQHIINKAEVIDTTTKLSGLHAALNAHLLDKETWPQEPDEDDKQTSDDVSTAGGGDAHAALWKWWMETMKPYGMREDSWFTKAHIRRLTREIKEAGGKADKAAIAEAMEVPSFQPASFDPGMTEPYRHANQPWAMETGEYHADAGVYCIMPDGRIVKVPTMSSMKALQSKGGGKP
jgi:prepilin-type N-terminal cleavage/methylation domain-containing protein